MTDAATAAGRAAVRDNERVLGVMLCLHATVHVAGFVLTWRLAEPSGFDYDDVWPTAGSAGGRLVGVAWLLAAAAVFVAGARLAAARDVAPSLLVGAHGLSLAVCLTALPAALPGAAISAAVIGAVLVLRLRRAEVPPTGEDLGPWTDPGAPEPG